MLSYLQSGPPEPKRKKIAGEAVLPPALQAEGVAKRSLAVLPPALVSINDLAKETFRERSAASSLECNHDDIPSLRLQDDGKYFAQAYLERNVFAIRACAICYMKFDGTGNYKVSPKTPIFTCEVARNTKDYCMFAMCQTCHTTASLSSAGASRSRRNNAGQNYHLI